MSLDNSDSDFHAILCVIPIGSFVSLYLYA
jgi:hypothetical protein